MIPTAKVRMAWLRLLIVGIACGSLAAIGTATEAAPDAKPSGDPAKQFFAEHCKGCHAGAKPKGDFRLESLTPDFADKDNRLRWLAVQKQLKAGTMPPK